ncbi:MAG: RNA polymerase sigma factor RpoD/SigA [Bacteroidia bacterium]|nr:RNA polymerase sigma factor RpoD/SigA [Bacteroidia bacterium]
MRQLKITKSITNRSAASLDKYLFDISKLPLITVEEEAQLAAEIRSGSANALEKLVSANLRFVVSVAKQYQHQGLSLQDLINEGNMGLMKAAKKFDETRGFKFISYAVWWIRQGIMQAISDQARVIRLPLNKIGVLNKIRKAQDVLEQKMERLPSSAELADYLSIDEKEIALTQQSSGWVISTDAHFSSHEDMTIMDVISDPENEKPDHSLMLNSLQIEINRALSTLSDREKDIVIHFYGLNGTPAISLQEIGEQLYLTRERVRQIKEKAVRKLKNNTRSKNLSSFLG